MAISCVEILACGFQSTLLIIKKADCAPIRVAVVVCDKKMSTKLKVMIYSTVARLVLVYGSEMWAL